MFTLSYYQLIGTPAESNAAALNYSYKAYHIHIGWYCIALYNIERCSQYLSMSFKYMRSKNIRDTLEFDAVHNIESSPLWHRWVVEALYCHVTGCHMCTCTNVIGLRFRLHFFSKSSVLIPGRSISSDSENYTLTFPFIGVKSLVVNHIDLLLNAAFAFISHLAIFFQILHTSLVLRLCWFSQLCFPTQHFF